MVKRRILAWLLAGLLLAGGPAHIAEPDDPADASESVPTVISNEVSQPESALQDPSAPVPDSMQPLPDPTLPSEPDETPLQADETPSESDVAPLQPDETSSEPDEAPLQPTEGEEEEMPLPVPGGQVIIEVTTSHHDAPSGGVSYETDRQKLVPLLRQALVARQEQLTLYYQTNNQNEMYEVANWLADQAMQETDKPYEGDYLRWQYGGWSCRITGSVIGSTYYLGLNYQYSYYTTLAQEQEVTRCVNAAISSFHFDSTTPDYQKVRTVYEYLLRNMTYDYAHLGDDNYMLQYTAYASIVNGTAVCQGYANILYRMLRECGVPCRLITGTSISNSGRGSHTWNIVCLNGKWYNLDLTWDDACQDAGLPGRPYFLRGSTAFDGAHIRDNNYTTAAFKAAYPVSVQDYAPTACDRNGHSWGAWVEDCTATYTEEGHRYRACQNCTARQEETLPVIPEPAVTTDDLTALVRYLAKIEPIEDEALLQKADLDGNGHVDANDLTILAQLIEDNAS